MTVAFPRSFPTSHQHKHRTSVAQTGLWGRSSQAAPDGRAALQEAAHLLLPSNLSFQVGVSDLLDPFGTLCSWHPTEMQCHQVGFGAHRGLEQQSGGAESHKLGC